MVTATRLLVFCLIGLSLAVPVLGATVLDPQQNILPFIGVSLVIISLFAGAFILKPKGREAGIYWTGAAVIAALAISSLFGAGSTAFAQVDKLPSNAALNTAILLASLVLAGATFSKSNSTFSKLSSNNNWYLAGSLFVASVVVLVLLNQSALNAPWFAQVNPLSGNGTVPVSLALVVGATLVVAIALTRNLSDKFILGAGIAAITFILTMSSIGNENRTQYASLGPLAQVQSKELGSNAVFDTVHNVLVQPEPGDKVVAQFNNVQITHYNFYSGSTLVATAEDLGIDEITSATQAADPNYVLIAGYSSDDFLQPVITTVSVTEADVTVVAVAPVDMLPTELYQNVIDGNLVTIASTPANTYIDVQPSTNPITSFTPDQITNPLSDFTAADANTVAAIAEDGTISTIDLASQEVTQTEISATDIVFPEVSPPSLIVSQTNYVPDGSVLVVNANGDVFFYDVNAQERTDLGVLSGTTATLTPDGNLVTVTDQTAYSAQLDPVAQTLTNYQSLDLNTVSTVSLDSASLTPAQDTLLAQSLPGEIQFAATAINANAYQVNVLVAAGRNYQAFVYHTLQPITSEQADSLTPTTIFNFNNVGAFAAVFTQQGTADLTRYYTAVRVIDVGVAEAANWVVARDPELSSPDTAVISPQCSGDPTVVCANTQTTQSSPTVTDTNTVTTDTRTTEPAVTTITADQTTTNDDVMTVSATQ